MSWDPILTNIMLELNEILLMYLFDCSFDVWFFIGCSSKAEGYYFLLESGKKASYSYSHIIDCTLFGEKLAKINYVFIFLVICFSKSDGVVISQQLTNTVFD